MAENRGRRAKYALCPRLLYVTPSASPDMSLRIHPKLWLRLCGDAVNISQQSRVPKNQFINAPTENR